MAAQWYAICSKPHKEEILWRQLYSSGYEVFYPRCLESTGNMSVLKVKPYFPGYLFIKVDLETVGVSAFQWMPFANGLIFLGDRPAFVPENLIHAIERRLQKVNAAIGEQLSSVDRHHDDSDAKNSLSGYEAIFNTNLPGRERNRILLQLLGDMNASTDPAQVCSAHKTNLG